MEATRPVNGKVNLLGLQKIEYDGSKTTLCAGCGHNSISQRIIDAAYELSLPQYKVIKLSGIGCSSKSPAYFMGRSHGINALHGRMPTVATGAMVANHHLLAIGVSGDGDTGSIGFSPYKHMMRRNVPLVYIIENNGVYGLTKGQFSATSDEGQKTKYYGTQRFPSLDMCMEAIVAGAGFVARSFSGDQKQLRPLLKAAFSHPGTAILDVISPCVTFADHEGSTKSYAAVKEHDAPLHDIEYVPYFEDITVDYEPGTTREVDMPDGSHLLLKKLGADYDPTDARAAIDVLHDARQEGKFVTGLLYVNPKTQPFTEELMLAETPLVALGQAELRPPKAVLDGIMRAYLEGSVAAGAGGG